MTRQNNLVMRCIIILLLCLFPLVESIWPEEVDDTTIDRMEIGPVPALQIDGNRLFYEYASRFFFDPGDLGLPPHKTTEGTSTNVAYGQLLDDSESGDDSDPKNESAPIIGTASLNCFFGNVMVEYRKVNELDGTDIVQTDHHKVFSQIIGRQTSILNEMHRVNATYQSDLFPEMRDNIENRDSKFTCWPTHGFHLHTGSEDSVERPVHLGPLCSSNEYFSVANRRCVPCARGQPDWFSALESAKDSHVQLFDPQLCQTTGLLNEFEKMARAYLGSVAMPFPCRILVEHLGFTILNGGDNVLMDFNQDIIACIHEQCSSSVHKEYNAIEIETPWNFKQLHIGNYHPFGPIRCNEADDDVDIRGDCGTCSYLDQDVCLTKDFVNYNTTEYPIHRCQKRLAGRTTYGLHKINHVEYDYLLPPYVQGMQLLLHPDQVYFEGPNMEGAMLRTEEEMRNQYCHTMKRDLTCEDKEPEPYTEPNIPVVDIFVSSGQKEYPYYEFYLNFECNGMTLNMTDGMYRLDTNTKYIFRRCANASTYPLSIHPVGADPEYKFGIIGDIGRILYTGGEGKFYEWYRTSNRTVNGIFVSTGSLGSTFIEEFVSLVSKKSCQSFAQRCQADVQPGDYTTSAERIIKPYLESRKCDTEVVRTDIYDELGGLRENIGISSVLSNVSNVTNVTNASNCFNAENAYRNGWVKGDLVGGTEVFVGRFKNEEECLKSVIENEPEASGATYSIKSHQCYAEFGFREPNLNLLFVSRKIEQSDRRQMVAMNYPENWVVSRLSTPKIVSFASESEVGAPPMQKPNMPAEIEQLKLIHDNNCTLMCETNATINETSKNGCKNDCDSISMNYTSFYEWSLLATQETYQQEDKNPLSLRYRFNRSLFYKDCIDQCDLIDEEWTLLLGMNLFPDRCKSICDATAFIPNSDTFFVYDSDFEEGNTTVDSLNFFNLYTFTADPELGQIKSFVHAIEYLDTEDAIFDSSIVQRKVLVLGVNYETLYGRKWASIHVVESQESKTKSLCLTGFNGDVKEIHGIAVLPLSQEIIYLDSLDELRLNPFAVKEDNGIVLVSFTDQQDRVSMWMTSYHGTPLNVHVNDPGSQVFPFPFKWKKYAIHSPSALTGYLLMAVITQDGSVYVFDGKIETTESFRIQSGHGIVASAEGSIHELPPQLQANQSVTYESVVDMEWTSDRKLLVMTRVNVYLYTPLRTDRPLINCQNKKRQHELDKLTPEGHYWTLETLKDCDLKLNKCESGTYQDERGQPSCKSCPRGKYEPFEGSIECKDCLAGRFQYFEGEDSCEECMPGFFSESGSYGLGPGEHSAIELEFTCDSCPAGYFSMEKSASHCKKCASTDYCDIESQIFPHAICSPNDDSWLEETDHLHQFCCSLESIDSEPYKKTMKLEFWRDSAKIYCVRRTKVKVLPLPEDCSAFEIQLQNALNSDPIDDIIKELDSLISVDALDDDSLQDLFDKIEDYTGQWLTDNEVSENATNASYVKALEYERNYTLGLINNITLDFEACLARSFETRRKNLILKHFKFEHDFNLSTVNLTSAAAIMDDDTLPITLASVDEANASVCYATTEAPTMATAFSQCCPSYADNGMSPSVVDANGQITLSKGENVYCMHIYQDISVDRSNLHTNNLTLISYVDDDPLGCFLTKTPVDNFHPMMESIFECCPRAKDAMANEDWQMWDFFNLDNASATCYQNYYGDCYVEYNYFNHSRVLISDDEVNIYEGECTDYNMTFEPYLVEYSSMTQCADDFEFRGFMIDYVEYSAADPCPEGWNTSYGQLEYMYITDGICEDYGYEAIPFEDCYVDQVWKKVLNEDFWKRIDSDSLLGPFPENCTVTVKTNDESLLSSADMMEHFTNQTCSDDFPCVCKIKANCEYVYTEEKDCSEDKLCMCIQNASSCLYPPGVNQTCTCQSETVIPDPGPYIARIPRDVQPNSGYIAEKKWEAADFEFSGGYIALGNINAVIVNEKTWENISLPIPVGVAAQSDSWTGAYTDNYHYDVDVFDTEQVLLNMRGGIDFESTRGTDEFRYCRHEYSVQTNVEMDAYRIVNNTNSTQNDFFIENGTIVTESNIAAIYCNSFFPITRLVDGKWVCSSVRECPLWEYWPPEINEYGFVDTDPCLCDGKEQYGGYCIPDAYSLAPKRGHPWEILHEIDSVNGASLAPSGYYMGVQNNNNIYIHKIDKNWTHVSGLAVESESSFILSEDGSTVVVHDTENKNISIISMEGSSWTPVVQYTEHVGTLATTRLPMAICQNEMVVGVLTAYALHIFEKDSTWKKRQTIQGFTSGNVALSRDGSTIAYSTSYGIRIYDWDGTQYEQRGSDIDLNSGLGLVKLSLDGSVVMVSDGNIARVFEWQNSWVQRGDGVLANGSIQGLGFFEDTSTILLCSSDRIFVTKWERRKWYSLASHNVSSVSFCELSADQSILTTLSDNQLSVIATGMKPDEYTSKNIWVTDVDILFTNTSLVQYYKPCGVGNIKKAANFTDWTDILWWQDVHERACSCQSDEGVQLCNGHRAQELFVGWNEPLSEKRLMTMTCASDGCVYDEIDKDRWQDAKDLYEDCSNARNETCGVYGFGKYHTEMSFKVLKGMYDSDNIVTSGVLKCENVNGLIRNNFLTDLPSESAIYHPDGDFLVMPNNMPSYCACAQALCHYDQYCKIVTDFNEEQFGYCGNTKHEIERKVIEDSILEKCITVPDTVLLIDLASKKVTQNCFCELANQERDYCRKDEYCTSKGCVECVCGKDEYELQTNGMSSCVKLTNCAIGEYVKDIQTQTSDRVCSPCVNDTYSPYQNAHKCVNCTKCPGSVKKFCTSSSDAICGPACAFDEEPMNGICIPKCEKGYHRLFNGTCIQCDFGQYFHENQCQNCPEGHYTLTRDKSLTSASVSDICFKHLTCDTTTHYWLRLPNASFQGTCVQRYTGTCAIRTRGNATSDDFCFNYRSVVEDYIVAAHAFENNVSSYITSFYLQSNENQISQIQYILETQRILDPSQITFLFPVVSRYLYRSRYMYQEEYNAEVMPYFDAQNGETKVRIYTHIDEYSLTEWNLPNHTFFVGRNVSSDVRSILFTKHKDIALDTGGWTCSSTSNYAFTCIDATPPEITLNGEEQIVLTNHSKYTEYGAIAYDEIDLNVTEGIRIQNNVNDTLEGDYEVIYSVSDLSGNQGIAIRNVRVVFYPIINMTNTTNTTN